LNIDASWVLYRAAAYLTGRGLTFGQPLIPPGAVYPQVYSMCIGLQRGNGVAGVDEKLDLITHNSLDHVLITPMLAATHFPEEVIRAAVSKLKKNGHIIILVNAGEERPGVACFYPQTIKDMLTKCAKWQLKAEYEEGGKCLIIAKRIEGSKGILPIKPIAAKRACIARYGALGDAIVISPLIKKLKEDGYETHLNISSYCAPVLENNPYVDNILIQERDLIPNHLLGPYWNFWKTQYDKYINLSESIEGDLLMVEGRAPFFTSKEWRHKTANKNYYDYTMKRAGYPEVLGTKGELFFTNAEERAAQKFFGALAGKFVIVWALNGSSHHKVYPLMEPTLREWFRQHPNSVVITVGDYTAKLLEFDHPQMIHKAGAWSIRESLISTKYANLVIGPETMMTNAAGCFATPKITFLSHSTHENLCKYWENDYCLEPDPELAPCYPCHQLHYTKESCPINEARDTVTGESLGIAPRCSLAIQPERLLATMEEVKALWGRSTRVELCEVGAV
jgi:ADP-heptose:LPS heptosyltransferase